MKRWNRCHQLLDSPPSRRSHPAAGSSVESVGTAQRFTAGWLNRKSQYYVTVCMNWGVSLPTGNYSCMPSNLAGGGGASGVLLAIASAATVADGSRAAGCHSMGSCDCVPADDVISSLCIGELMLQLLPLELKHRHLQFSCVCVLLLLFAMRTISNCSHSCDKRLDLDSLSTSCDAAIRTGTWRFAVFFSQNFDAVKMSWAKRKVKTGPQQNTVI